MALSTEDAKKKRVLELRIKINRSKIAIKEREEKEETLKKQAKKPEPKTTFLERLSDTEKRTPFGLPEKLSKVVFPSATKRIKTDKGIKASAATGVIGGLEALGTPTRLLGKLRGFKAGDPESAIFRPEIEKTKAHIDKPSKLGVIMRKGLPLRKVTPKEQQVKKKILKGAVEIAGGAASDPFVLFGGLSGLSKTATKKVNKFTGRITQELTGISEEALRKAGTKVGRKALEGASGTQRKIGVKLNSMIDDFDKFLPEKQIVEKAVNNMPNIDMTDIISSLDNLKLLKGTSSAGSVNASLSRLKKLWTDLSVKKVPASKIVGLSGKPLRSAKKINVKVSAKDYRTIRKQLDAELKSSFSKDAGAGSLLEKQLTQVRRKMKDQLIESAKKSGNGEYVAAMESWSRKLQVLDDVKKLVGTNSQARDKRVQALVANLFGKNKEAQQDIIERIGDIFGEDFISDIKLARLADEIGEGGKAALISKGTKPKDFLNVASAPATSPLLHSRITLPATSTAEKIAGKVKIPGMSKISGASSSLSKMLADNRDREREKKKKFEGLKTL